MVRGGGAGARPRGPGIAAVLFDAGNTLVSLDRDRTLSILREAGVKTDLDRLARAELAARLALDRTVGPGSSGTEPEVWREYLGTLFRESGVPASRAEAVGRMIVDEHVETHLWTHVHPETPGTLKVLLGRGYRLAVISNADGRMEGVLRAAGLREFFEFVIDSHEVGWEKPDRRIFQEACRRLALPPEACLYVGDLFNVDVRGARGAGLHAVLLDPTGQIDHPVDRIAALTELVEYLEGWAASPTETNVPDSGHP